MSGMKEKAWAFDYLDGIKRKLEELSTELGKIRPYMIPYSTVADLKRVSLYLQDAERNLQKVVDATADHKDLTDVV